MQRSTTAAHWRSRQSRYAAVPPGGAAAAHAAASLAQQVRATKCAHMPRSTPSADMDRRSASNAVTDGAGRLAERSASRHLPARTSETAPGTVRLYAKTLVYASGYAALLSRNALSVASSKTTG